MAQSQTQCLLNAIEEVRRNDELEDDVAEQVVETLQASVKRLSGDAEAQFEAAMARMRYATRQAYVAKVAKAANERWRAGIQEKLADMPLEERARWVRNLLEYDSSYRRQDTRHVAGEVRAEENALLGQLNKIFDEITETHLGVPRDSEFAKTFHAEMRGVDTGDPKAKELVSRFRDAVSPYLERARKAGLYVEEMPNWAMQTHNRTKILRNFDEWKAYFVQHLDPDHHPDPEATAEHVYRSLMGASTQQKGQSTLTMGRKIHFQTPEAEFEYNLRFGEDGFANLLFSHTRSLARKAVMAERLGPSPVQNLRSVLEPLREQVQQARADAARAGDSAAEKRLARAEQRGLIVLPGDITATEAVARNLVGELSTPENQTLADFMAANRNLMAFSMLGQVAMAASLQDSWISMFSARFHAGGLGRGIMENMRALRDVIGDENTREWAQELGVWDHVLHASMANRMHNFTDAVDEALDSGSGASWARKYRSATAKGATATQRLSLAHQVDRGLRSAYMVMSSRMMAKRLRTQNWADLDARYKRMLEANAIGEGQWRRLQREHKVREGVGAIEVNDLEPELRSQVLTMLYREADMAVVHPGQYDRLLLTGYSQAGTPQGELIASTTQFLSWPTSFFRGALRREVAMGGTGMIGFFGAMTASAALTTQAYAFSRNEPMYEWDSPELWQRSLARSGLLSPIGEAILDGMTSGPRGNLLEGPLTSTAMRALNTLGQGTMDVMDGEAGKAARRLLKTGEATVVPNIWWLQYSVTSRAMDSALETLDPEYVRNRERRFEREGRREE